jgi:hypothetical protein
MEEPLSPTMYQYDPVLKNPGLPGQWRLCANFADPKEIILRFGKWPNDLLNAERLEAAYRRLSSDADAPECLRSLSFLDNSAGSKIAAVYNENKDALYRPFRMGLQELALLLRSLCSSTEFMSSSSEEGSFCSAIGAILLTLQALLVFEFRHVEKRLGLWSERGDDQKIGTVFAVRPQNETPFVRVELFQLTEDLTLGLPWGGVYRDYGTLLALLEDNAVIQVLSSIDENLEVVPYGHGIKQCVKAGFVREERLSLMNSRWFIGLPVVEEKDMARLMPALRRTSAGVGDALPTVLPSLIRAQSTCGASSLTRVGDGLEAAYGVLFGLLVQWAVDDGLVPAPAELVLKRTPELVRSDRKGAVAGLVGLGGARSRDQCSHPLPGISLLRGAQAIWERLLAN